MKGYTTGLRSLVKSQTVVCPPRSQLWTCEYVTRSPSFPSPSQPPIVFLVCFPSECWIENIFSEVQNFKNGLGNQNRSAIKWHSSFHCISRSQISSSLVLLSHFDHWSLYPRSVPWQASPLWSSSEPILCMGNLLISPTYICLARVINAFIILDHPANILSSIWMPRPTMALLFCTLRLCQSLTIISHS